MKRTISMLLAMTCVATLNAIDHDVVTSAQYQEAENLLYARNPQQSNYANYYKEGVKKLCTLYQACHKQVAQDSAPCAHVTLALAKAYHEQLAFDEHGNHAYPLRAKSFELFDEVTARYPDVRDPNVWAVATFYQADNARWGMNKPQNYAESVALYKQVIAHPAVTDTVVVAWAQGRLGDSYREGQGVTRDAVKSVQLFQAIIDNAHNISDKSIVAWAEFWVAGAYEHGSGREKDPNKARDLFDAITKTYIETDPVAVEHAQWRKNNIKQ